MKSINRIIYHIVFWIAFLFLYPIWFINAFSEQYVNNLLSNLCVLPGFIIGLYFIVYYLIPKLLLKDKKYLLFLFIYILLVVVLAFNDLLINRFVFLPLFAPDYIPKYETYYLGFRSIYRVIVMIQSQVFIFISIKYLKNYIEYYFEREKIKSQAKETQLKALKSNIHPHFLFNTLNNIYTLSIVGDNEKISQSVDRLSQILRYSIYDSDNDFILLDKEIQIIENYIHLEKIRYSNIKVNFAIPKNSEGVYIIPMLLFTFVENAFKFGTSNLISDKWIDIQLDINNNKFYFCIKNSKSSSEQSNFMDYSDGVGLKNAQKRLDLYLGKDNYTLKIEDKTNEFEVVLIHKIINYENKVFNN